MKFPENVILGALIVENTFRINISLYVINVIPYEKKIKQLCENVKPVLFR